MTEKTIDLHTHTVYSDGSMTPRELVRHACESGLSAVAVSDHDSVGGVSEAVAAGKEFGIEVVPAIELSVKSDTETHILGYYIDTSNAELDQKLKEVKKVRARRNEETSELLAKAGFDVKVSEAEALAPGGLVGRAHFARVMVNKGYVPSVKYAFDEYLANGRPCYSDTQCLTPEEGVSLIKSAGGGAFVAHLHLIRLEDGPLRVFLDRLKGYGLDGIEGYYTEYTPEMQDKYQKMASEMGLMISGGTDFHGKMKPHISIGKGLGNMSIPYSVLEKIKERFA